MDMETKCSVCGVTEEDLQITEGMLVYDDDGNLLCTDCFFEKQCMEDYDADI